jgi:uncharacterized protein (DUF1684 family)
MSQLSEYRRGKDEFFRNDPHSPLPVQQRRVFSGLNYYPENPDLRFEVKVERYEEPQAIRMQTSTGDVQDYVRYGRFRFEVDGQPAELTVYSSGDGDAFVPFADATSGHETYGAGRYLELERHGHDHYYADFNLAYNPWCAYSALYSCPFPPPENRLKIPIRAGEKDFEQPPQSPENLHEHGHEHHHYHH